VLQVASDLTIHAQSHNLPRHPRSAEADRAPSPFESLLDDSAPAADRSAPPPDDKASHADGSQSVRTSGNSQDSKAPPAHDDDDATKSQDEANVDGIRSEESAVECKVGTNAKVVIHCAPASDDRKFAGDDKPAETKETDNLVPASLPVESVETNIRVDAIAAVTTPAPQSEHRQVPQLPEQAAPAAQLATQLKPIDPELLMDVVGKYAKVEKQGEPYKKASANEELETGQASDQPVGTPATLQASPAARGSGKQLHATEDSDLQHIAQARGEQPVSDHSHSDMPAPPADNLVPQRGLPDPSTPLMASTQTHAASNAAKAGTLVSQPDLQPAAIAVAGLAIEIAGKALAGKNRFEIRSIRPNSGA
jgi:hypothetical protein